MVRRKWLDFGLGILILMFVIIGVLGIWRASSIPTDQPVMGEQDIPILQINLANTSLEEIHAGDKAVKYPGNGLVLSDGLATQEFENVEIKGRGNSTWGMDKRPYQIKFDHKVDLLGMGRAKKWVLLANFWDVSQLRNDVALKLAEMLDMEYTTRGRYVELEIDGDYRGLYYLMHKVDIGKGSVDLRDPLGVLVELDNLHQENCYWSEKGACLTLKDAVNEDMQEVGMNAFVEDFSLLEAAAEVGDYATVESVIDVESWAKYFLLSEFTVNPDAYATSWFLYKDGEEDKIHAGPAWDYDFALGNRDWGWHTTENFYSPELNMVRELDAMGGEYVLDGEVFEKEPDRNIVRVMYYLMKMPEFRAEVERIFNEKMSGRGNELLGHLEWQAERIYEGYLDDYEKWGRGEYTDEVEYLTDWVGRRYRHFEMEYGGAENVYDFKLYDIIEREV